MERFGTPEELTGTLLYLVSDLSKFVTGVVIPVDGGFSAYSGCVNGREQGSREQGSRLGS